MWVILYKFVGYNDGEVIRREVRDTLPSKFVKREEKSIRGYKDRKQFQCAGVVDLSMFSI